MNDDSMALMKAIRGPVIMIVVGALFALDQFTTISFRQSWPAILIVVGLLSLAGWTPRSRL